MFACPDFWIPDIPFGQRDGRQWLRSYTATMLKEPMNNDEREYLDPEFADAFGKALESRLDLRDGSYSWYNYAVTAGDFPSSGPLTPERWCRINAQCCHTYGQNPNFNGVDVEHHRRIYFKIAKDKHTELVHIWRPFCLG
ncbi:hypothetical protein D9758_012502 [Tetrapyrgos nigripes]|uniref:Uncharacterized protein n=1 Tax=Tetrapyrgos nigripes TaxID=182062 RepID=A0A8H5LHC4_9AGAR|nr:hypothetical protein D9758_012502 [Tetrapyrgos nigripes]